MLEKTKEIIDTVAATCTRSMRADTINVGYFFSRRPKEKWIKEQVCDEIHLLQINDKDYEVVSLKGDGHCGYYAIIFGLDYNGICRGFCR